MTEKADRVRTDHSSAVERIREAESFRVHLPIVGWVRIPRPENLAFYGALAGLAGFNLIHWSVAVVLGVGHALTSRSKNDEGSHENTIAGIEELRTEVRRLAEMLARNGDGDQGSRAFAPSSEHQSRSDL
jgi:hypothetical protein